MRNPQVVLDNLTNKSNDETYKYQRVYRNLYNPEFYLMAYDDIYPNPGNMTKGSDNKTIDGMSMKRITNIIDSLRDEKYQPTPVRRTYIEKNVVMAKDHLVFHHLMTNCYKLLSNIFWKVFMKVRSVTNLMDIDQTKAVTRLLSKSPTHLME